MKVFAAEWKKTTVTVIRASDLWNKDTLEPGDETKKNKFNRLFSELREEAAADLPEETREARLSTLPLIDARYNEAYAELMALLDTWVRDKREELAESGAYNVTTGILFKDYGGGYDGPEAHVAYLITLDEKILRYYHDTRDACEIAVRAGGYSGDWIVSDWEVERKITGRHGQLLDQARTWMRPSLAEIAILRPKSDYENLVRTRAGKTMESAAAWTTLEAKFFQAALEVVNELGRRVYEGTPEDFMPSELKTAEQLIRLRGTRYEEGQLLPLLALPCSEVNAILDSLDAILPQILDGSETAKVYNRTYALLHTYQQLRCAVGVSDPERTRYERHVKLTDSNMRGFQAVLDDYWKTVLLWAKVEKEAAQSGRSQEYQAAKTTVYAEIEEMVVKIQDDPWGGPLGRDPSGKIVPYAGIGIGYELYGDWIRTMAYEAHKEIKDLFTGVEKAVIEPEIYIVTEEYVAALLKKYSEMWDDPEHGVALQPGFIKHSVLDPAWKTFETIIRGKIGSPSLIGIGQFEKDVETEYVKVVLAVRDKVTGLRLSKADEFPVRIKEIEELTEALPYSAYTVEDASNLLAELRLLHPQVPWNSDLQARYGAIYNALMEFIEPRGGVLKIAYRSETNAYYLDAESAFKDDTERDKILAEWIGMDYGAALSAWQNGAWSGLIALDEKPDLTEWQYPTEQAAIIRSATATYLQWRGSLIDTARARLTSLTDRLRTRTTTMEDRALAESGRNLIHPFLRTEIEELGIALEQMLPGAVLPAALKPFALFEPLKSVSGFDVEEFSFKHLDKLIKNWAEPRIKDGIQCEPKINAYRIVLEAKDGDCRIYLEGVKKDYSKIYKHLATEIKALPIVILDGELTEEIKGKPIARAELGKYRRSAVDDTNAIVEVWDILYFEDKDLHNKPYSERREYLDKFFAGRSFKHLRKLPSWKVTSIDDLIAKAKKADAYPNSEGAMFKTSDSKYLLGKRTGEWSKVKKTTDLQVMILKVTKTKADDYVYRCGVLVKDVKGIDPKEIERRGAKEYVVLGNTFRTPIVAKPGDHLEVSITELVEQEGPQGKKYNWMLPKVKDKTTRAVDTLLYAREVGQLLSASIDLPWKFLTDKLNEALATVSVPRLRALKAELFGVLADFNYIRLVRYAWNVVELIRERLGQAVDPLITNRGVEKIYEIGTVPRTTDRMLDEARSDYKVLTEDIQSSPQQKAKRGRALAQILQGYVKMATGSLLALAEELLKEVQGFISILVTSGTQSILDIDRKLADIERRLDDLLREEPDTLAEDVASLQTELKILVKAIGESRDLFADRIDAIFSRMEEVELPLHTSADVREWLRLTQMLISEAIGKIPMEAEVNRAVRELQACLEEHGGRIAECMDLQEAWLEARDKLERAREDLPATRFLLESTLPLQLTGYWDEMTDTQKTIFKEDFDRLRTVLRETKKMLEGLRGAFLWAAAKPLKLDLGCGQNKAPDFIGIDIKPGLGVDKVWDLSKGLSYPDDVADEIRAYHILEHLSNPIQIMSEIWRVLRDGGFLRFEIPSTKGEGADADPLHKSRWCRLSFAFYTDDELRESHEIPCKFDIVSIEEEEDPETGAVYVRGILRARKTGRYASPESVVPHFFALRSGASKATRRAGDGQQLASQSIPAAEEVLEEIQAEPVMEPSLAGEVMDVEEVTRQLLSEINWADIAFYSGTGNPRVRVSPGAERILEPADYENGVRDEVLAQDWIPLIREIMGRTKDKTEIAERFQRKLHIYVRNSTELARNLDAIAKQRDPKEYEWLGRMEYEAPPGATEEWFSIAKAKASLAQDPMMLEILEEFGPEGVNVFNKAIGNVASGLVDVSGCGGYYGGVAPTGIPFFVTAMHCVRKGRLPAPYVEKTLVTLPSGEIVKLTPGVAYKDTQILFAENSQEAAMIIKANMPLRLGTEPSGWALVLGTHFSEAELLRRIGERYEGYVSIFNKAEDVYEELHRYRGGYSGGPIINSNGEVIGLSSGQYFVSPSFGDGTIKRVSDEPSPNKFAAYSSLETLKELYGLNGIPLPGYLGGARRPIERDGLYIIRRHADLIVSKEKKIIIKSKESPIAKRKLYLITGDEILGEIELEEPEQIDMKRFSELRIQSLIKESEREEWWKDITRFYSYKIRSFKAFEPPKKYEQKQGVQTIQKAVIPLTAAGNVIDWIVKAWLNWEAKTGLQRAQFPDFTKTVSRALWVEIQVLRKSGIDETESTVMLLFEEVVARYPVPAPLVDLERIIEAARSALSSGRVKTGFPPEMKRFLTSENWQERNRKLVEWWAGTDFTEAAQGIVDAGGNWLELRDHILELAAEHIQSFDQELFKNLRLAVSKDLNDFLIQALRRVFSEDVKRYFSYGALEYITSAEWNERDDKIAKWIQETDFTQLAQEIKSAGLNIEILRERIYELAAEFIKPFDYELEKRARARKPKDYPWALEPEEIWEGPPGATLEWRLTTSIKNSLTRDPFMRDLEEFEGRGMGPFYQAIDHVANSLVTVADPERTKGGIGPHHASCGGYYAGTDSDGYPLYVTATHCFGPGGNLVILADGRTVLADVMARHEDSMMLRGREPIDAMKALELGIAEGGWALGLSPLYGEGELIRYDENIEFDPEMYVTVGHPEERVGYGMINLGRSGWSGSPVVNSRGEILGIASLGRGRRIIWYEETGPDWALGYVPLRDLQELYRKAGKAGLTWKGILGGAKLTEKGEQPGNERLDWMAAEPSKIPIKGTLWTHVRGIDSRHKDLDYNGMMKLSTKDDVLNLHHDVRFLWQARYLEGFTLFLGNQEDKDKLLKYDGGKLGCSLKTKQPSIWGDPKELDNRLFPPGGVGNVSGKDTWGKMFLVDRVSLLPSRMRSKPKGKRYFEFALAFEKHKELNGLWGITEEAGKEYELPFLLFKLKETVPFWSRGKKKHEEEIGEMPEWMKPTQEEIDEFLKE